MDLVEKKKESSNMYFVGHRAYGVVVGINVMGGKPVAKAGRRSGAVGLLVLSRDCHMLIITFLKVGNEGVKKGGKREWRGK